jgi:hypothetical protein
MGPSIDPEDYAFPIRVISPAGTDLNFVLCDTCQHMVGATKKVCECDGLCHPVKEAYSAEDAAAEKAADRKRELRKRREDAKPKRPKREYNDLTRI